MSPDTCEWVTALVRRGHRIVFEFFERYWVMSHLQINDGTVMSESLHTYEVDILIIHGLSEWCSVMSHMWMSDGTDMNKSLHTYERGYQHYIRFLQMLSRHVTQTNEAWHTCECVMAHMWMSHDTHMNKLSTLYYISLNSVVSCHTCEWVMAQIWIGHCTNMKGVISIALDSSECCHVMSHTRMSHGTHVNESRHTYQQTISIILDFSE